MDATKDARRALGVRPGRVPELKLNLGDDLYVPVEVEPPRAPRATSPGDKSSPSFRDFSLPLPRRGSTSPSSPRSPSLGVGEFQARLRRATIRPKDPTLPQSEAPRGLYESQKLLSHVLGRLEGREAPPDTLERAIVHARASEVIHQHKRRSGAGGVRQLSQAVVGVAQSGIQVGQAGVSAVRGITSAEAVGSEDDQKDEKIWDERGTYELVEQLRDLLLLAEKQGLHLLQGDHGRSAQDRAGPGHKTGYPAGEDPVPLAYPPPTLRDRITAILRSLTSTDSHYHITSFGPLSPPNALQSVTLDIATYLYHSAVGPERIEVVEIMLDALYTFKEGMKERVYSWLEERVGEILAMLASARGVDSAGDHPIEHKVNLARSDIPSFSFTPDRPSLSGRHRSGKQVSGSHSTSLAQADLALRLGSLVVRLLSAICETTNLDTAPLSMIHRVHRLLALLLSSKPDAPLNLLEVVAFAPPHSKYLAMSILTTYFPLTMGHNIIARRPQDLSYRARLVKWETGRADVSEDDAEAHHYIHWRVSSKDPSILPTSTCTTCEGDIHGFCIKCTLCGDVQHLGCYRSPEGTFLYEVRDVGNPHTQPIVISVKFSRQLPTLQEILAAGTTRAGAPTASRQTIGGHEVHRVHLFSSTPCQVCLKPIWASPSSIYACLLGCQAFFHSECISRLADPHHSVCQSRRSWPIAHFTSTANSLNETLEAAKSLCVQAEDLHEYSHDEVAVLYGALWIRYQTLKAGILGQSLLIADDDVSSDPLDLRPILRSYEDFLTAQASSASGASIDFAHIYGCDGPLEQGYLFCGTNLAYITALLKSPDPNGEIEPSGPPTEQATHSSMPMDTIRALLKEDMSIHHAAPAQALLFQLELSGLVRMASSSIIGATPLVNLDLPLLAESSPSVEILIEGIASCLDSLDLSMVEQASILLTNRAWPSLLCTPHALERLGSVVVRWVISEEEVLHRIVREYASKHRALPGLRTIQGASTSRTSGPVQAYQEARNAILRRYIQPWLEALHEQDGDLYAQILYDECRSPFTTHISQIADGGADGASLANLALDRLVSMVDAGITFSCLLELLTLWLDDLGVLADQASYPLSDVVRDGLHHQNVVFKSVPRLVSRHTSPPPGSVDPRDIFSLATETASVSAAGLIRACRWIRVLAFSGAEVPWHTIRTLIELGKESPSGTMMETRVDIAIAIQANVTYLDPNGMAEICGNLLVEHVAGMKKQPVLPAGSIGEQYLTRLLHLVLRAYGVRDDRILPTGLSDGRIAVKQTTSGMKTQARRSALTVLRGIPLDEAVILAATRLVQLGAYHISRLMDFLWLLFTQASAASNADELAYSLASILYQVFWPLVDLDVDRKIRTRLLVKLITVNPSPLESIIAKDLASFGRQTTIERLLKFMLELGDTLASDSHNWRSDITNIALLLFTAISDPGHSDAAAMSIRHSILPAHLRSIALCFEASLIASSDERRSALLVQLRQVRLQCPLWPVISWPVLDELLTETVVSVKQAAPGKSSQNNFALLDSQNVRYQLIALGLEMLSTGIYIPYVLAQRFQQHVAAVCALPWDEPSQGMMDIVLPAIRDALDSPRHIAMFSAPDGESVLASRTKTALVGSLFVPAVIDFAGVLAADKPIISQRCLLDILLIIFHKHNIIAVLHPALKALQNVAAFVEQSDCTDNRVLGLAIVQAALDRMQREDLVRVVPSVFLALSTTLCKEAKDGGYGTITDQCGILLRRMIKMFGRAGLLLNVLRLDGSVTVHFAATSIPAEALLRLYPISKSYEGVTISSALSLLFNELPDILKRGRLALDQVLASLARFVPAMRDSIDAEAVDAYGSFLGKLGKHIAEWTAADIDPEHILQATSIVLGIATRNQATPFSCQVATFLHLCLSQFDVSEDALKDVLIASAGLESSSKTHPDDVAVIVVRELAIAATQGLGVTPITLSTLLNFVIDRHRRQSPRIPGSSARTSTNEFLHTTSRGCLRILLRQHPTLHFPKQDAQRSFEILDRASTLLLLAERESPGALNESLSPLVVESPQQQINVFTSILSCASSSSAMDFGYALAALTNLYPVLSRAVVATLRRVTELLIRPDAEAASTGAEMLSSVLIAVRLTFLAVPAGEGRKGNRALEVFWMGVGSEWSRLVALSVGPLCVNGSLRFTTHSVFLDTVLFLASAHPALCAETSMKSSLDELVRFAEETGAGGGKLLRAVEAVKIEGPAVELSRAGRTKLLDIVKGDMAATERLRSLRDSTIGI